MKISTEENIPTKDSSQLGVNTYIKIKGITAKFDKDSYRTSKNGYRISDWVYPDELPVHLRGSKSTWYMCQVSTNDLDNRTFIIDASVKVLRYGSLTAKDICFVSYIEK